ncbi:MAG: hypothetical protein AABX35_03270 [Nanoarchaeota archaeon]
MARKTPQKLYARNFDSAFKQTKLQGKLDRNYQDSKDSFGANSDTLKTITDLAGKQAYSHGKRLTMINEALAGKNLTASEREYAQSVLNTQYQYIKSTATEGRKVKDFSETAKKAYALKNDMQTENGYSQFEANTKYLDNAQPENIVQVKFTPSPQTMETRQPSKGLETIVVPADFTQNTTPDNVTSVSFLGRATKSLGRLAAVGTLLGVTAFYGIFGTSCKPGPDPKGKLIAQLQAEKAELQSETNRLGDTVSNLHSNYDATMSELMTLKTNYADATNTSHNLSTNLAALTTQYNLATNDLATTSNNLATLTKEHSLATNDLVKAEVKLTGLQADLGSSIIRNVEMTNKLGSANLKILSASNDLFTATNQLAGLRKDYGNASNQVTELKGYLSTAKTDSRKAEEQARLTAEQLAKERKAHSETSNKLQRTTGTLEATTRDYTNALEQNRNLSGNLTTSARNLAIANSTLQDRLREVNQFRSNYTAKTEELGKTKAQLATTSSNLDNTSKELSGVKSQFRLLSLEHFDATNRLALTKRNLAEANGKYNAMAHLQGQTAHNLSTTRLNLANTSNSLVVMTKDYNSTSTALDNTRDALLGLTGKYDSATNDLASTTRELKKHTDLQEMERQAEERRVQEGKTVDKLISVSPLELPLSVARFSKDGKRLQNIQEVPYYGDGFVDTFSELRSFARAIGNTYQPTNNDAIIPIWFGKTKLSNTETATVLREIPTSDLKRLGTFLENASTNAGSITFTNDTGVFTIGSTKRLRAILGAKK